MKQMIAVAMNMKCRTWSAAALLRRACALCIPAALLSGCISSAPMRFYTLSEVSPEGGATPTSTATNGIRIARVSLPRELDRIELVQRLDANRVRIAEQDRWAAPLDDMIRRALAADLQTRMGKETGATAFATPDGSTARPGEPAMSALDLDIEEFVGDSTCAVTLRASWQIRPPGGKGEPRGSGHELIQIPAPSSSTCTIGALPPAMSQALARLAERILAARR